MFREDGGPTLYSHSNRTPVFGDITTVTVCIAFGTLYAAFFVIFPGIRTERVTTFLSVTLSLFVGSAILVGNSGCCWHVGGTSIAAAYKAFSSEKFKGDVGVYIGLDHVNITLDAVPQWEDIVGKSSNQSRLVFIDVHFNERFEWRGPTQMMDEYRMALKRGLPFPLLTVVEYFAVNSEGFAWGRTYREAGYYTSIFLWASFLMWLLMNVLIVVVPRYGAFTMTLTGWTMLFACSLYYWMLPQKPLEIHFEEAVISLRLGWCFWINILAGTVCLCFGICISLVDLLYPHKFSTIMEMDYGTPFDRVTIIELSNEHKKRKKVRQQPGQESPQSLFTGLIRRLSKREKGSSAREFHDNYAFEMEAPKSPWRYPHIFLAGKSPKFGKSPRHQPGQKQGSLQPGSPRGQRVQQQQSQFLSPSSAQRQVEVQHHEAPRTAPRPPRLPLRRIESTSTCSSAEEASSASAAARRQQRHRRRRSLSATEARETAAGIVAVMVDHDDSSGDDNGDSAERDVGVG